MNDPVWKLLGHVLLAALLGTVGQLIRVVAGLKKLNDTNSAASLSNQAAAAGGPPPITPEPFKPAVLFTSLGIAVCIGALAGVLSSILGGYADTRQAMLAIVGAGYSGTDFIEAFMRKVGSQ
jgi:hypothetical protein